jgi:hypothetical protein
MIIDDEIPSIDVIEDRAVAELSPSLCDDEVYSFARQMGASMNDALMVVANLTGNTEYKPRGCR